MTILASLSADTARYRILGVKDAAAFCGVSAKTFSRMRDRLPAHIPLSDRRIGWRIGDLIDWQECRETGRDWRDCRGSKAA